MRKIVMKKLFSVVLSFALLFCVSGNAFAESVSFSETVKMISELSVDDALLFTGRMQIDTPKENIGARMVWEVDLDSGRFVLYDNDSSDTYMWAQIDANHVGYAFDLLGSMLIDYIDFDRGGSISLRLSDSVTEEVYVDVAFSKNMEALEKNSLAADYEKYDEWDAFIERVNQSFADIGKEIPVTEQAEA